MDAKNGPSALLLVGLGFGALLPFAIIHSGSLKEWHWCHCSFHKNIRRMALVPFFELARQFIENGNNAILCELIGRRTLVPFFASLTIVSQTHRENRIV